MGRSQSGTGHHPVDILALGNERLTDGQLIGGESTGLVGTEDIDTSERFNGSQFLDNGLLFGEVSSTDGKSRGGDNGQTDGHANDEQDQNVVEQRVERVLGSGNLQVTEEATDPGGQNPEHDQDEEGGTDAIHDGLEMALILGALDESGSATDERVFGRGQADSVSLATFAAGGVVNHVTHELVHGERFSGDGGLISGDNGVTLVLDAFALFALFLFGTGGVLFGVEFVLLAELLVALEIFGGVVVADQAGVSGDSLTFLDDHDVTGDELAGLDVLFLTSADDSGLHGDVTLQLGDNVGGLFFLVPTDGGVEH